MKAIQDAFSQTIGYFDSNTLLSKIKITSPAKKIRRKLKILDKFYSSKSAMIVQNKSDIQLKKAITVKNLKLVVGKKGETGGNSPEKQSQKLNGTYLPIRNKLLQSQCSLLNIRNSNPNLNSDEKGILSNFTPRWNRFKNINQTILDEILKTKDESENVKSNIKQPPSRTRNVTNTFRQKLVTTKKDDTTEDDLNTLRIILPYSSRSNTGGKVKANPKIQNHASVIAPTFHITRDVPINSEFLPSTDRNQKETIPILQLPIRSKCVLIPRHGLKKNFVFKGIEDQLQKKINSEDEEYYCINRADDMQPREMFKNFKIELLKENARIKNILDDLKRTQTMNETLLKVYTRKLRVDSFKTKGIL